ncbi:hypothetical protein L7F22_047598 [Adiantum nelumboides]|nr:hypothetical protein [Adiantum nelumboides]
MQLQQSVFQYPTSFLQVVEWLLKERPFEPVEDNYARWLLYLGKVSGYEKVERAFEDIPSEFQNDMVYCRLFDVALFNNKLTKAIGVMKRMRKQELPVPVYMFNNLITYYARNSLLYKLPGLLRLMEEQDIPYNLQTYNTLLSLTSKRADLEHMEEVWGLLQADDCMKPDFVSYSILASAYFFAGQHKKSLSAARKAERHLRGKGLTVLMLKKLIVMNGLLKQGESVSRIYRKLKALPGKTSVFSYTSVIEAYGEAGLVDKAEEVMQEMELQCNMQHLVQYNTMIGVYCKNGMVRNAEEVLEKLLTNHKPDIVTHSHFLLGYLKSEEYERALQKLNALVNLVKGCKFDWFVFGSRSWLLSIHSAIGLFAERGDKEHANLLLTTLQETDTESFPSSYKFLTNVYEQSFGCAWER